MILTCVRLKKTSGAGVKLTASAIIISILSSWTALVRRKDISPCESWLVITVLAAMGQAGALGFTNYHSIEGEGLGMVMMAIALLWLNISNMWFWVNLSRTLPSLGTKDLVWFFAPVHVNHWFRSMMIVTSSLNFLICIFVGLVCVQMISSAIRFWATGKADTLRPQWDSDSLTGLRLFVCVFCFVVWLLTIASAEKIIVYNDLAPENDLSKPGQMIPFVIGLIVFVDGLLAVGRRYV